jgi:hypothetical protein
MWDFIKACIGVLTPVFLVLSPVISYSDQALSMHRNKSSAGFSLDIPLIMLVASFLRIFYWFGARFDVSLLAQAVLMVGMQVILLKIALDHRPSTKGAELPFAGAQDGGSGWRRPYDFWQWRSPKPYWQFLIYLLAFLSACELLLSPLETVYPAYSAAIGYIGLSVEAILPLPQIYTNIKAGCIKGFRLSILASWLAGDAMKMTWFFTSTTPIPWPFKMCGIFQACCDSTLGVQYWWYGSSGQSAVVVKDHAVEMGAFLPGGIPVPVPGQSSIPSGSHSHSHGPRRSSAPDEPPLLAEKEYRG